ncbi:hypothetical protein K493DRAFT_318000 [Basidiobolus meristosporus CBS 931.73]|uniref:Uncharacterized protein n=1 Tax=Basidiobolus meristosporus CBS 931.73 TaxID=1314790 RepID=A0A1Y1XY47_9FUNG|nr:hypothetical protein K493DRAFT_318000 [Basidiobolus meristosporus CBS 931.73]|eukprot:ORX90406.1 hypothetical protein K493DRAFT_318000 [Basidiobolus meristosporus CBS 931.73]
MLLGAHVKRYGLLLLVVLVVCMISGRSAKAEPSNVRPVFDLTELEDLDVNGLRLFGATLPSLNLGSRISQLGSGIRSATKSIGGSISNIAKGITSRLPKISFTSLRSSLRFPNISALTSKIHLPSYFSPRQLFRRIPFIGKGWFVDTTANVNVKPNEDAIAYGLDESKIDFNSLVVIHEKVKLAGEKARRLKGY